MAATFYLTNTASDVTRQQDGFNVNKALSLARGSGLAASFDTPTAAGPSAFVRVLADATNRLDFYTLPLAPVLIAGDIIMNFWMSENNASANCQATVEVQRCANDGTVLSQIVPLLSPGAEMSVGTRAAQNWTEVAGNVTDTQINIGERIRVAIYATDFGTMASGFTFNLGYGATSAGVDGDSFVTFAEDVQLAGVSAGLAMRTDVNRPFGAF